MNGKAITGGEIALGSPFEFSRSTASAAWRSASAFAKTAEHADDLAVIRSMWTDIPAHEVATVFMNTGSLRIAKPSMGSWLVYGLGTENQNLPGFIALRGGGLPPGGATNYQSAFLPGVYQGTSINTQAPSVPQMIQNIRNTYVTAKEQRRQLDLVHQLNDLHAKNLQRDAALETRLESYEIAFRMQAESLDAFDINKESAATRAAYGITASRASSSSSPAASSSAASASSRSGTPAGITTSSSRPASPTRPAKSTSPSPRSSPISSSAACSTPPSSSGAANSAASPPATATATTTPAATTTPKRSPSCSPAAASRAALSTAPPTSSAPPPSTTRSTRTTSTPPSCIAWASTTTKLTYRFNGRDFRLTDVAGNVVKPLLS
jgi:hypothetical protein